MKSTTYRFGGASFKAQFRTVGQGWEVCVNYGKKNVFVGNFIHKAEATKWWNTMNREMRAFTNTYWIANKSATNWYATFVSNHLYKCYYRFLDKLFVKYNRTYTTHFNKNVKKYNSLRRGWTKSHRYHLVKAA
jgi:hypothetical protein